MSEPTYKPGEIRKLLIESFTSEELRQLCYDEFSSVYDSLSTNASPLEMAQRLIDYCQRKSQMAQLLAIVRERVPERYAEAEANLIDETAIIRELLKVPFITDRKFRQICLNEFRPVFEEFGQKTDIPQLVQYCVKNRLLERLLAIVKQQHPDHYAKYEKGVQMEIERIRDSQQDYLSQPDFDSPNVPIVVGNTTEPVPSSSSMTMPDENEQLQKRIVQRTRVLYNLQLQAAKFGISVPPHIAIEIEDLEKEIAELQEKLDTNR